MQHVITDTDEYRDITTAEASALTGRGVIAPCLICNDEEPFEVLTYHFVPGKDWADVDAGLTTDAT